MSSYVGAVQYNRRDCNNYNKQNYSKEDGNYVIRDEGMIPLVNYKKNVKK